MCIINRLPTSAFNQKDFQFFNFYFWEIISKCGQRMPDFDAGEGKKKLEYSSKFIRQILLQETPAQNIPPSTLNKYSTKLERRGFIFGNVLFLSLWALLRGERCFVKRLPRGSRPMDHLRNGELPAWPGTPINGPSWFPLWSWGDVNLKCETKIHS